ncbi:MAG TPA: carboxypeptidase-like regulatory domain-containing protein, partial [Pyrinomonadaceae bacterium]|nr:carboxypeptidase-like regulatory domain-containing protein [Pyrinomonadaceae bacterium]
MFPNLCRRVPAIVVAVLCLAVTASAQESRATLTGRVSDPTGASIPGASVSVRSQQTNIDVNVTTGDDGNYTVTPLQPGRYTVTVEAQGFKRAQSDIVELHTADKATFDVSLEVGDVGETVTVNADAPLLEADTASRGQVVENERIRELPLVGRNPINLATLATGVTFNGNPQ